MRDKPVLTQSTNKNRLEPQHVAEAAVADAVLRDGQAVQRPEVVEVLDAPGSTER